MPTDKFDVSKEAEVEGMSEADFAVWKSSKQSEIATFITGSLAPPGRTLITMSINAYVMSADTLRQLAEVTSSDHRNKFDKDKKKETLKQLRGQFENGRKLFNFALVNASKYESHRIFPQDN